MKLFLGEGDAGRSGFYGASNFGYDGVPEFTAYRGTVCTVESRVSGFNSCVFCEVQLCLVSCSCEYCGSVPSYLVFSGP